MFSNSEWIDGLVRDPHSFAGVVDEGVVGAMGMIEQTPGTLRCWALTDPQLTKRHFVAVCRKMRAYMAECRARRIETIVQFGNVAGHRWVTEVLGFTRPHVMKAYNEYGDAVLYERIA